MKYVCGRVPVGAGERFATCGNPLGKVSGKTYQGLAVTKPVSWLLNHSVLCITSILVVKLIGLLLTIRITSTYGAEFL